MLIGASSLPAVFAGRDGTAILARPMLREDLERVIAIEREIFPFPWSPGNFVDSLAAGYDAWAFEVGGGIGGYAIVMWIPDEVHLLNLSVAAGLQGRGIGRAILQWLMADAAARGARGMLLEVRPSNAPAIALYRSEGFDDIGLRKRYYPSWNNTREDARVMFRRLP